MSDWKSVLLWLVGTNEPSKSLNSLQMGMRAAVAYLVAVAVIRVGHRRFMGRNSAIDVVVAVTFGSTLSRGLTGNSPLVPVLVACGVLVLLDWMLARLSMRRPQLGEWIKGRDVELIREGQLQTEAMRRESISDLDLLEGMRLHGRATDQSQVRAARLERNGKISFVLWEPTSPQVMDVPVAAGVQTVRIVVG